MVSFGFRFFGKRGERPRWCVGHIISRMGILYSRQPTSHPTSHPRNNQPTWDGVLPYNQFLWPMRTQINRVYMTFSFYIWNLLMSMRHFEWLTNNNAVACVADVPYINFSFFFCFNCGPKKLPWKGWRHVVYTVGFIYIYVLSAIFVFNLRIVLECFFYFHFYITPHMTNYGLAIRISFQVSYGWIYAMLSQSSFASFHF